MLDSAEESQKTPPSQIRPHGLVFVSDPADACGAQVERPNVSAARWARPTHCRHGGPPIGRRPGKEPPRTIRTTTGSDRILASILNVWRDSERLGAGSPLCHYFGICCCCGGDLPGSRTKAFRLAPRATPTTPPSSRSGHYQTEGTSPCHRPKGARSPTGSLGIPPR
jgi:hypothetical protein